MLTHYIDQDSHLLEMTIAGKVGRDELTKVMNEIEQPLNEWEDVRVLKQVDNVTGIEPMALIDDLKFAYNNFSKYQKIKKVAVVTDRNWVEKLTDLFTPVFPGEVKL